MNDQLKPIFEIVIPVIVAQNIQYWIYGGIANAAMVGKFYRTKENPDVDLFVLEDDFAKTEKILEELCNKNGWKICKTFLNDRPKIEIVISGKECLAIVPIYTKGEFVELIFEKEITKLPKDFLQQIERNFDGYVFYSLSDEYLKKLFIVYLNSRRNMKGQMKFANNDIKRKRIEDARYILIEEEFKKYFPNENYDQNI